MASDKTYLTFQYPVLLEPIRVINPFPLRAARTRVIVRWDFPVFTINSALVIPGFSRKQLSTACSRSLIWSFIWPFSWPDNGDLFRSILENSILKSVSAFSYIGHASITMFDCSANGMNRQKSYIKAKSPKKIRKD